MTASLKYDDLTRVDFALNDFLYAYNLVKIGEENPLIARDGTKTWDTANALIEIDPTYPLTTFKSRNLNLQYLAMEFFWYLKGDRFDDGICKYAKMWQKLKQADGGFNSNYGQYLWTEHGVQWVINSLLNNKYSRQASITLLQPHHLVAGNTDVVCTYSINFRIRYDRLDMSIAMRSNDVIFGLTNDAFCFSMIHQLVYNLLVSRGMKNLDLGEYTHYVNSLHVYERHFDMLTNIVNNFAEEKYEVDFPRMSVNDALILWSHKQGPSIEELAQICANESTSPFLSTIGRWALEGK